MILPFRETWFSMDFMIFFFTSFGIDFRWVLASILLVTVCWMFCLSMLIQKWFPKVDDGTTLFLYFSDPVPQVLFLKNDLLALAPFWQSFGNLLAPFRSFWVSVRPCLQNTSRISDGDLHRKEAFPLHSPLSHLARSGTLAARALINRHLLHIHIHVCPHTRFCFLAPLAGGRRDQNIVVQL